MPEISNYLHDPVLLYKYDKRRVWALHISVLLPVPCVWREPSGN